MVSTSTYFSTSKDQKSTRKVVVHTNLAEKKQYKSTHTCAVFPDYFAKKSSLFWPKLKNNYQISIQISEKLLYFWMESVALVRQIIVQILLKFFYFYFFFGGGEQIQRISNFPDFSRLFDIFGLMSMSLPRSNAKF